MALVDRAEVEPPKPNFEEENRNAGESESAAAAATAAPPPPAPSLPASIEACAASRHTEGRDSRAALEEGIGSHRRASRMISETASASRANIASRSRAEAAFLSDADPSKPPRCFRNNAQHSNVETSRCFVETGETVECKKIRCKY